jgi:hypothetical protein
MHDSEARAILRAHGEDVPGRGKLGADARARAVHYADQDAGPADLIGDDYQDGTSPDDFGPEPVDAAEPGRADAPVDLEPAEPPALRPEQRPRRPKRGAYDSGKAAGPSPAGRFRNWAKQPRQPGGRPHKRVPVDGLISSVWAAMGGLAGNVDPPVGRVLTMQAPVAGVILEDVVRHTAADRVLQPIARAEVKAEKVLALVGPPTIVAALEATASLPEAQMRARQAILLPLLERSLILWLRIAGDKVEEMAKRQAAEAPAREQVQELVRLIWPPLPTEEPATDDAERETVDA